MSVSNLGKASTGVVFLYGEIFKVTSLELIFADANSLICVTLNGGRLVMVVSMVESMALLVTASIVCLDEG